ncbi:MAG: DinB family protein [Bacteroidota bacterium]|nr:DinB family protein [Bacteroidota bacterium]
MQNTLAYIKRTREQFIKLVNELSEEQLNKIPAGFSNNIAWNFGHIIVTVPVLAYQRSGVNKEIVVPFQEKYQKGTRPESFISKQEIATLQQQLTDSIASIELDISTGKFNTMETFTTATFGLPISSIEETLNCILAHDAMHYGYALAIRKAVLNQ